jgi:predicted RNA-binding protein with PUA-like domain
MNYFLVKTDPDTYSLDDFMREGATIWDGVHSYAAIGFIKQMRVGDFVYVYESQGPKSIVGVAKVIGKPFENTNDPRPSWAVQLQFVRKLATPITLAEIKNEPSMQDFALVKQSRLSVMPVPQDVNKWLNQKIG